MRRSRMFAAAMLANLHSSYDEKCEYDPKNGQDSRYFDVTMVRALPLEAFWMPLIEKMANAYGPQLWLTRVEPQFRCHGIWLNDHDRGRFVVVEMTYDEKGHRCLIGIPAAEVAETLLDKRFLPLIGDHEFRIPGYLSEESIEIWMD